MIKLTRERIYEIAGGNRSTYEIARAIEAEVLRINGASEERDLHLLRSQPAVVTVIALVEFVFNVPPR